MEIVFTDKKNELLQDSCVTGFYGDVVDFMKHGIDIDGIVYDERHTVKRFLNGIRFSLNKRIPYIFNYLDMDSSILDKRICDLSKKDFKFVLLAKLLLENKKIIIFDYFDVGLTYKDKKKLIKIIRTMKQDGKTICIISKDLVFMNSIVDKLVIVKDGEFVYNGKLSEVINSDLVHEEEIIKFIRLANKKKAKLEYTLDSKELLKDIYRSVY